MSVELELCGIILKAGNVFCGCTRKGNGSATLFDQIPLSLPCLMNTSLPVLSGYFQNTSGP